MKGRTRSAILDAALQLFGRDGVEQAGTRDIAGAVGISLGNLTYYFPAKTDIIRALCDQLIVEIDDQILAAETMSGDALTRHFRLMEGVFKVQLRYRFIFNSRYAEIVTAMPEVQEYYQKVLKGRFLFWKELHRQFVGDKLAAPALLDDTVALSYTLNILALFWHQEFAIYSPELSDQKKVRHALAIYFQAYRPYLSKKGRSIYDGLVMLLAAY